MRFSPDARAILLTVALLVVAVSARPPSLVAQARAAEVSAAVQPGDRVNLSVFTAAGQPLLEASGRRTVDRNGQIFLPYVGSVEVQGHSASEIREILAERYADFYANPVIDVEAEIRVNVTGAVRQPGNYFFSPTSTVVDALATAGGATSEVESTGIAGAADLSEVRLVRDGRTRSLDLRPEAEDLAPIQLLVQSGDWLHVPPRPSSRWRSNLQLLSGIFSVAGSIAALVILLGG